MANPRRRKAFKDNVSPAELSWLTGEGIEALTGMDRWMFDQLQAGQCSWFKGQPRRPDELLERFAALVPDDRLEELRGALADGEGR
ncbi:hypothetical protein CK501_05730 [Halovibrio salipaludis]|uniref:Uncharacterized protein n=1 Tax=Halovibrio salipaludis TaxID=2032626 RepID=A0A2A2F8X1_9GAMM|nr:hypothetical protein [Halovibrio salipaludis]PAU81062.1 hypothetical protein CK501_05730 [Halovibrio salipaludis]